MRVAARVYGRDSAWVRAGIIGGWLPIGKATRNGAVITDIKQMDSRYGRISYYISPKLLYEETRYIMGTVSVEIDSSLYGVIRK